MGESALSFLRPRGHALGRPRRDYLHRASLPLHCAPGPSNGGHRGRGKLPLSEFQLLGVGSPYGRTLVTELDGSEHWVYPKSEFQTRFRG